MHKLHYQICPRLQGDAAFCSFVANLPTRFSEEGETVYDKRNVIKFFTLGGETIVVKRFKKLAFLQRILYTFLRKTKAERAFKNATLLLERGISTPEPLAYAEEKKGALITYGYFVSSADFAPPIFTALYCADHSIDLLAANAFGRYLAHLHQQGVLHHDLNGTNVLCHAIPDGGYSFSLIDINRMNFYTPGSNISSALRYENMSKYCGNMALFLCVAKAYAHEMGGDEAQTVADMVEAKRRHDLKWKRRNAFKRKFKALFK